MPEGNTSDQQDQQGQPSGTEPPPPPDQQIQLEISTGKVVEWLGGLFGTEWNSPQAGGGGTGGQFMFASVADLDSVISQWETELTAITQDGDKIKRAAGLIGPPANDSMSVAQSDATTESLNALYDHNEAMRVYAQDYIAKLKASRQSIVNTEEGNRTTMTNVDRS